MALYGLENDAFRSYVTCGTVSLCKMMIFSPVVGVLRWKEKAFANPEDARPVGPGYKEAVRLSDKVERVRRCHLNDVENIPAFLALGAMYLATKPSPTVAMWHFRIFAISRVFHTIIYMIGVQPYRAISYLFGLGVNFSMATQILLATLKFDA